MSDNTVICYNCGATMIDEGDDLYTCPVCGDVYDPTYYPNELFEYEDNETGEGWNWPNDPPAHEGFYMDVDGESAHFFADPNMSKETEDALKNMVRHVRKLLDSGWKPKGDSK